MIKNIKALQTYGKFVQKHPLVGISITSGNIFLDKKIMFKPRVIYLN
jgi:hypothetical protein